MGIRRPSSGRHRGRRSHRPFVPDFSAVDMGILVVGFIVAVASGVIAYRIGGPYGERLEVDRRVHRVFNEETGRLELLVYDLDGNLRFDARSYMDGETVLRTEYDDDEDGLVDIWEFFRPDQTTERLEEDTDGDGSPDLRTLFDATGAITAEISLVDNPDHDRTGVGNTASAEMEKMR